MATILPSGVADDIPHLPTSPDGVQLLRSHEANVWVAAGHSMVPFAFSSPTVWVSG